MNQQKSSGKCLCGSVSWTISGVPEPRYHCHCSMCRKAHGAAFATYAYVTPENFEWNSGTTTIKAFASSDVLIRSFCSSCGSVVPNATDDQEVDIVIPLGSHNTAANIESHIFVAAKAPWHEITDSLPKYDFFPPMDEEVEVIDSPALSPATDGILRGSCLCNAVGFEVNEPFKSVFNCHCSRCRQARSAAHTTLGFTSAFGTKITRGAERLITYKPEEAKVFSHVFCDTCGSGMPRIDSDRDIAVVPLGALDDDPGCTADGHIFTNSKADWYPITDGLPCYEEYPK